MKIKSVFFLIALVFLAAGIQPVQAADAGLKFATVDVAKVFDQYNKTKDNDKTLQDAGKKKEQERDAIVRDIRQLKDEMTLLADDAKAKKQDVLEAQMKKLADFDATARQALGEQRNKVVREIFKDIDDTISRFSEKKGYDVVFNERALLYHGVKYDITQEVLNDLNKNYKPGKK